jgi:hypothetical protein
MVLTVDRFGKKNDKHYHLQTSALRVLLLI